MGIAIAAVWLIAEWRNVARILGVAAILAYGAVSIWYAGLWRDTFTLFTHANAVTENNTFAHLILGNVLLADNQMDAANAEYAEAVRLGNGGALPLAAYGNVLVQQKRYDEAIEPLQRALALDPNAAQARENLAIALIRSGRTAAASEHIDAAEKAVRENPTALGWNNLGSAYSSKNDFANAERAYREAIRLDPKSYDARMNLGAMLSRAGRNDEALALVREAAKIAPDSVEPRVYAALIEAQMLRKAEAANDAAEAMRIDATKANDYFTNALHIPPKDTNLADFIATMRAR